MVDPARRFWAICIVWFLVLTTLAVRNPPFIAENPDDPDATRKGPRAGDLLDLSGSVSTLTGDTIPVVQHTGRTLFLVVSSGCPKSIRELATYYPDLITAASGIGIAVRIVVVLPSGPNDQWFLNRLPSAAPAVVDTARVWISRLRATVAPSAILVDADGVVAGFFSPSGQWPVTDRDLASPRE